MGNAEEEPAFWVGLGFPELVSRPTSTRPTSEALPAMLPSSAHITLMKGIPEYHIRVPGGKQLLIDAMNLQVLNFCRDAEYIRAFLVPSPHMSKLCLDSYCEVAALVAALRKGLLNY